jgi:pyruvate dehydrogenase E2 component (dihydrolipoamide acetyltransferase)
VIEIKMPRLSDTMAEGAIAAWHKHPGDTVAVGDVLVEIETDKAVMEYEAYQGGTLAQILVAEGSNADIGTPIALLDDGTGLEDGAGLDDGTGLEDGAGAAEGTGATAAPGPAAAPGHGDEREEPAPFGSADRSHPAATAAPAGGAAVNGAGRQPASPLVRKLARDNHLDLSHVAGSGPGGRIIRADISGLLAGGAPAPVTAEPAAPEVVPGPVPAGAAVVPPAPEADEVRGSRALPVSQVRRVIARRLSASASEIPHFYVTAAADAQDLMDLRVTLNAQLTAAGRPKISVNDLLIRACALALRENPLVNVSYGGDGASTMLVHDRVNIGVAVAAESGLIVPVVRDADTKTVTQLGAEAKRLVALAAERKLTPAQTSGGTFSISNLGMYGVEQFTAIINPPEAAILAVGATTREPAVVGDTLEARYRMRYTLSVDHRVIDGALAAQFLRTLTNLIEHPWMIIA